VVKAGTGAPTRYDSWRARITIMPNRYKKYSKAQERYYKNVHKRIYSGFKCANKVSYGESRASEKAISESARLGFPLIKYRCPVCGNWHLTKKYRR